MGLIVLIVAVLLLAGGMPKGSLNPALGFPVSSKFREAHATPAVELGSLIVAVVALVVLGYLPGGF